MVFEKYGADFFLSNKLNQDPVEEHFGRIRGAGGASDNPTLEQYCYRNRKIIVAKSELIQVTKGNTSVRENIQINIHDERKLPKTPKRDCQWYYIYLHNNISFDHITFFKRQIDLCIWL